MLGGSRGAGCDPVAPHVPNPAAKNQRKSSGAWIPHAQERLADCGGSGCSGAPQCPAAVPRDACGLPSPRLHAWEPSGRSAMDTEVCARDPPRLTAAPAHGSLTLMCVVEPSGPGAGTSGHDQCHRRIFYVWVSGKVASTAPLSKRAAKC